MSIHTGAPRSATVETLSDVRLVALPATAFQRLLDTHPVLHERVADQVAFYERGPSQSVPLDFAEDPLPARPDGAGADGTTAPGTTLDDDADRAAAPVSARGGCRRGRHVPEIAQRLLLGPRTVRMQLASAAIKLDLDSPAELAPVLSEDSLERTAVL